MDIEKVVAVVLFLLVFAHFKYMCETTRTDKHLSYCEHLLNGTPSPHVMPTTEANDSITDRRVGDIVTKMCSVEGSEDGQTRSFVAYGTNGEKHFVACNNKHLAFL